MNKDEYIIPYDDTIMKLFAERSVEREGKFILPYLLPGLNVLDVGAGPGYITVGMAQHQPQAKIIGCDLSDSQVAMATKLAQEQQLTNVSFKQANIYSLPFEDASFDLVFCNAVLCQLSDVDVAIQEIRRVLKPNGLFCAREVDFSGGTIFHPDNPYINAAENKRIIYMNGMGNDYCIGRKVTSLMSKANFVSQHLGQTGEVLTGKFLEAFVSYLQNIIWHDDSAAVTFLLKQGHLDSLEQVSHYRTALGELSKQPDAMMNVLFFETIGKKL